MNDTPQKLVCLVTLALAQTFPSEITHQFAMHLHDLGERACADGDTMTGTAATSLAATLAQAANRKAAHTQHR